MVEVSEVFQGPKFQSLCHDLLFHCRFIFVFCLWYFKQTVILIIYSFLCFTAWSINVWLSGRSFQYFGKKQVMWKYRLFLSTLPTSKITSCYVIWTMDNVLYFVVLRTTAAEIVVEKSSICVEKFSRYRIFFHQIRIGIKFNLISIQKNIRLFVAIVG